MTNGNLKSKTFYIKDLNSLEVAMWKSIQEDHNYSVSNIDLKKHVSMDNVFRLNSKDFLQFKIKDLFLRWVITFGRGADKIAIQSIAEFDEVLSRDKGKSFGPTSDPDCDIMYDVQYPHMEHNQVVKFNIRKCKVDSNSKNFALARNKLKDF